MEDADRILSNNRFFYIKGFQTVWKMTAQDICFKQENIQKNNS